VLIAIAFFVGMAASGCPDSHGGSQDLVDWRFNHVPLPSWNNRHICKCGRVATIDT
jgi:hypothetical protein